MGFLPLNKRVQVKPVEIDSIIATTKTTYEEKGEVLNVADGVTIVKVGQTVYFDSWMCSKYTDNNGNICWLVPQENIQACE